MELKEQEVSNRMVIEREINQDHVLCALTTCMKLGIRLSLKRITNHIDSDGLEESQSARPSELTNSLTPNDFKFQMQYTFRLDDTQNIASHRLSTNNFKRPCRLKDYCPRAFRTIRQMSGISDECYLNSVAAEAPYIEFITNSKSGNFFFYSNDGKYMIKTHSKEESKVLRRILPAYMEHICRNPSSLLVRFFGMYQVKINFQQSTIGLSSFSSHVYFVIMNCVFDNERPIHFKYDLKGSTVGRFVKDTTAIATNFDSTSLSTAILKDVNLVNSGRKLVFTESHAEQFKENLQRDSNFLASLNIMDYSLLVGIHVPSLVSVKDKDFKEENELTTAKLSSRLSSQSGMSDESNNTAEFRLFGQGIRSASPSGEVYYLGIIDILQEYNISKRGETLFKSIYQDGNKISSVHPKYYVIRFNEFLLSCTNCIGSEVEPLQHPIDKSLYLSQSPSEKTIKLSESSYYNTDNDHIYSSPTTPSSPVDQIDFLFPKLRA